MERGKVERGIGTLGKRKVERARTEPCQLFVPFFRRSLLTRRLSEDWIGVLPPFFGLFSQTSMQTVICHCHLYRFLWPLSLKVAEDEWDENELNWLSSLLSLILS